MAKDSDSISSSATANNPTNNTVVISPGSTILQPSQIITFNPASQLQLKLTGSSNYSTWKAQVTTLLFGYDLDSYIDGTSVCPPSFIHDDDREIANPACKLWQRQDSLVRNAIIASVAATVAPLIAHATTAKQAWDILQTTYANKSQSRIFALKNMLHDLRRNERPVSDYLRDVKAIADDLATCGAPVSDADLVFKALSSLGPSYHSIATSIRSRDTPITFPELYEKLLSHELFLKHFEITPEAPVITAQFTQRNNNNNTGRSRGNNASRNRGNFHSSGNHSSSNNRYSGQQQNTFHRPNNGRGNQQNRPQCQLCERWGHTARFCRSKSHNASDAKAYYADKPTENANQSWIVDTGATHHMSNDPTSLKSATEFTGTDDIIIGDGKSIPISHIGQSTLISPKSDKKFHLTNILCFPHITRNLLSVKQFCKDNHVSVEFNESCFHVKDLSTRESLLRGQNKGNLYE